MKYLLNTNIYIVFRSNEISAKKFLAILQITADKRASIDELVTNKLKEKNIKIDNLLGARHIQNKINQIVLKLKTDIATHVLFNRALKAGELMTDMDFAIRKLIHNIYNNEKQRHKHI